MKRTILFLAIVFVSVYSFAQGSIEGTVMDAATGEKLPGADIELLDTKLGTSTNLQGFFKLEYIPNGIYKMSVSYVGYRTFFKDITIKEGENKTINVSLQEDRESLKEVMIIAKSKARKLRERAAPISVISMSQLQGTVSSITDVLNKTVGVTIRRSGGVGSASRLSVRGLEGKRIGFFIDDTPMNDNSDFIDINDIPTDMIDRIEIYKGVVPARFSGSAMGGAVNIVIKEYPARYADMSYGLESFNTHKFQTVIKRNLEEKGIEIGGGGFYTYSDNDYIMESPHARRLRIKRNHDKFKKIVGALAFKARKWWFDEIEIETPITYTYRKIQGIERDVREANISSMAYVLGNKLQKDNFFIAGLDFDMSTSIAYTQYALEDTAKNWYDWDGTAYPTPSALGGELGQFPADSDDKKFTMINRLNLEYLLADQHTLNFNSFFTLANGYPKDDLKQKALGKQVDFDSKMRSWTAGLSYDFRTKDDKFLNSVTARYYIYTMNTKHQDIYVATANLEDISLNKSDFGINNALRYRFTPDFMGKFSAGYDVRIPSESELLGDGYTIEPAELLLPERNTSVNIGVLYDLTGKKSSNLQLELNGFYMHLKDMIRFTKGFLGAQYQNFGEMQTLGVELEVKADMLPTLYGYGNITYQDLRDIREHEEKSTLPNPTKGMRMPNIPYLMANAGLEFHKENLFGGTGQNTRIFADLSFIEEYFYDFEMTKHDKRRIPRSTTIDVGFEHSFMNQRLFISGKLRNLTDAKVLSEFNRPLPGRNLGVKLRYIFK
ncbi:MAG: TonB-dependent receptor [Draconibacterium sp.]|nr:MAG: TonB-dependent receptor [Draconibacterium sp.]